jgi:hypothetical protein
MARLIEAERQRLQAATTLIAWTPPDLATTLRPDWRRTAGTVNLIPWPDRSGEAEAYARLDGACCSRWRSAPRDELIARIFIVYAKMTLHGMNPLGVHLGLSGLEEYRDNLPPELAVVRHDPGPSAQVVRLEDYRHPFLAPTPAQRASDA